jgi:hypothetical protein
MSGLPSAPPPAHYRTSLLNARARQCRFIVSSETREAMVCGAPTSETSSWCSYHSQLVYLPERERRRAA